MLDQSFDTSAKARLILAAILRVNAKRQSAADLAKRRALRPVHGIADAMRSELKRAFLKSFNKDEINDEASALAAVDRNYDVFNGFLIGLLHRGVIASGQVHSKLGIRTLGGPGSGPQKGDGTSRPVVISDSLAGHKGMEMVSVKDISKYATEDRRIQPKSEANITEPTQSLLPRLTKELQDGAAIQEPLVIAYDSSTGKMLLADGNTRLAAIVDAGFTHAPVIISRQSLHGFGKKAPTEPQKEAAVSNWLLPSKLGLKTLKRTSRIAADIRTLLPRDQHFFDSSNPASIEWAREHAGKLITGMKEDAKAAVRTIIADGIEQGRSVKDTAELLKDAVGLTERQGNSLLDLRDQLEEEGLSKSEIRDELAARSEEMTDDRAEVIARTETMAAANEGQQELWDQAIEKGLLTGAEMKEWIYTPDGNACDDCEELDGQTVPVDEEFPDGDPPLHPNCRCTFGISASDERTLIARNLGGPGSGPQKGDGPMAGEKPGQHTPAAQQRVMAYLSKETGMQFAAHGSVGKGKTSKNDMDITVPDPTRGMTEEQKNAWEEKQNEDYNAHQQELMDKVDRGEISYEETFTGDPPDLLGNAMEKIGFLHEKDMEWGGIYVSRFVNKKTRHTIEIWQKGQEKSYYLEAAEDAPDAIRVWLLREPRVLGGPGSGNFGHEGRPGEIGGSGGSGGNPNEGTGLPSGSVEDGLNVEHPDVAAELERYTINNDRRGIADALAQDDYPAYSDHLQLLLKSVYGDEPIAVIRKEGYTGTRGSKAAVEYKSVTTNPSWSGTKFFISRQDVVLAGNESEGELIVKSIALRKAEGRVLGGPGSGPQGGRSKLEKDYVASLKQNGLNAPETKAAFDALHAHDMRGQTSTMYFHGTSSQAADKILSEGLIPKGSKGADEWLLKESGESWETAQIDDREVAVFITRNFYTAEEYADHAKEINPGSKAVVLRVDVPKSAESNLSFDEFSADPTGADVYYKGKIPREWISVVSKVEKVKSLADGSDPFFFVILTDESEPRDAGGPGSGNFDHEGRPGEVGGAGASGGWSGPKTDQDKERITKLGVPPAWTDVRLNPDPSGDLQATGVDSKGRKQYLYSAEHSERASAEKFERLKEFNKEVGQIQEKIQADLDNPNLSQKDAESARALYLISKTGFRVGSEESSVYGATTLRAEHVKIDGEKVAFSFVGKHNVPITKEIEDKQLATILKPRVDAGGRLFQTTDTDVRDYLHARDGDFKVKDFRTWQGTARAMQEVKSLKAPKTDREFKIARMTVARAVAAHLGNTPKVALDSYISPTVFSKWKSRL
jgi:DNA topoisomerase-1